jgi:hypothetical protein
MYRSDDKRDSAYIVPSDECSHVAGKHVPGIVAEIRHMARSIDKEFGGRMRNLTFRRAQRRNQIVVSSPNDQPHVRAAAHGDAEIAGVRLVGTCAGTATVVPTRVDRTKRNDFIVFVDRNTQLIVLTLVEAADETGRLLAHCGIVSNRVLAIGLEGKRVA